MDSWPTISEYKAALQHPQRIFTDAWLRQTSPTLDKNRLPFGISGGFGVVFPMTGGDKKALKCFTEGKRDLLQQRYWAIQAYLSEHGWPAYMVHFRYLVDAMLVQGAYHPVLLMDWVDGPRLNAWLRTQIAQQNAGAIRAMADRWCSLVLDLADRGIAHGDLQHGNVLVVGAQPVLVDYDGMFIPGELHMPPEGGYPGYQHPQRARQTPTKSIDHFSAWVILLALRAVAADLTFFDQDDEHLDDTLLFLDTDLEEPDRSWVWPRLLQSTDLEVRAWAQALRACLDQPFERIPPFQPCSRQDLRLAQQRQDHLNLLRSIPTDNCQTADRAFCVAWESARECLAGLPDAEPFAQQFRQCKERVDLVRRLTAWAEDPALADADEEPIDLLAKLPAGYLFELAADADWLWRDAGRIRATLIAVNRADANLDYACIREYPHVFEPYRAAIERLAEAAIVRVELHAIWAQPADGVLRLTWHWDRWAKCRYQCCYAVTAERWLESPGDGDPHRGEGCLSVEIEAYQRLCRLAGGVAIALPAGADEAFITIWPVLPLGWRDIVGNPLHVGPVAVKSRRKWLAALGLSQ